MLFDTVRQSMNKYVFLGESIPFLKNFSKFLDKQDSMSI